MAFLELRCGNDITPHKWVAGSFVIKNYTCDQNSVEISEVLTDGPHHLEFKFGEDVGFANNNALDQVDLRVTKSVEPTTATLLG